MSKPFKVPPFVSKEFQQRKGQGHDSIQDFIKSYKEWRDCSFTRSLLYYIENEYDKRLIEQEGISKFRSLFESKYYNAYNSAERKTLKHIAKQLKE